MISLSALFSRNECLLNKKIGIKMVDDTDIIQSLPLSCLPLKTRELLSFLLDTPKIIPNDGPDKLPR